MKQALNVSCNETVDHTHFVTVKGEGIFIHVQTVYCRSNVGPPDLPIFQYVQQKRLLILFRLLKLDLMCLFSLQMTLKQVINLLCLVFCTLFA